MSFFTEKKFNLKLVALALFFSFSSAFAGEIEIKEGDNELIITENTYQRLGLYNSLASLNYFKVKTDEGEFAELNVPTYHFTNIVGAPKIPVKRELIEVPHNASVEVNITSFMVQEYSLEDWGINTLLMPAQAPAPKDGSPIEFVYDPEAYAKDEFYPQELVTVDLLGEMRGIQIGRLNIAAIQYNPVSGMVRVYEDVEFEINFDNANVSATIESKKLSHMPFFNAVNQQLLNYKPLEGKELIMDEPVKYVIIADPMFQSTLQPFIQWKIKKGFEVIEAYTDDPNVGNTTSSIRTYLEDLYNQGTPTDPPPAFALIVGDVQQVPAWSGNAGYHVTDLNYFEYTGDLFPELYYGRFSAQNVSQLQPQIDKTLQYEQYTMPDPTYLSDVVLVAGMDSGHGNDWANGQINYGVENYFNAAHGINAHVYLYPQSGGQSSQIQQDISNGVTFANYTAHCSSNGWADPSFSVSDIPNLNNADKYGLWIGNCCSSSEFDANECFAEAALRANSKGAVGYIGGSNSTYWDEDYYWGVGVGNISEDPPSYSETTLGCYDAVFHDHGEPTDDWYITGAQMFVAGNFAVTESGSSLEEYYWEIYCIMGDPSLMVYFSEPPAMNVSYDPLMPLGSANFTVTAEPYAYVAISKDGVLHGAGIADQTGVVDVELFDPISVPGTADIVVTKQNGQPFVGTVTVASPTGPYVLFDEMSIDDSNGNNNGIADYGENLLFDVTLQNVGNSTATNLTATLTTSDNHVNITNDTHTWPDIPSGSTSIESGAFTLDVENMVPDQHIVQFTLDVTDGSENWSSNFSMTLCAPVLAVGNVIIDDMSGNNNGRLDPGETADIIVSNSNEGHSDAMNTVAELMVGSGPITVNTSSSNLNTLVPGGSADAVFNVTVDAGAQIGDIVVFNYELTSGSYVVQEDMSMNIGLVVEDFESGDFSSFEWTMGGDADWIITQTGPYEGVYSAKSGDINDDQTSELSITLDVTNDDQISFFRKVSSESSYDYLRFYIDGVLKGEWDGEEGWSEVSYDVTAGNHTFKWAYEKDYSVSNGSDCGWIDYIIFPPVNYAAPLTVNANANPPEICAGGSSQLSAFAYGGTGNYTYSWTPAASLSDPNIANPEATPSQTTTYTVTVDDGADQMDAEATVTVNPTPETPTITQVDNYLHSSAASGNQWYDSDGAIAGATGQDYYPTATDDYYVIVTNQYGCESDASNVYHYIYLGFFEVDKEKQLSISPNPASDKLVVKYLVERNSQVQISLLNSFGQVAATIEPAKQRTPGMYQVVYNTERLGNGMYFIKYQTAEDIIIKKVIVKK